MGVPARGATLHKRRFSRSSWRRPIELKEPQSLTKRSLPAASALVLFSLALVLFSRRPRKTCSTAAPASSAIVASSSLPLQAADSSKRAFQVVVLTHSRKDSLIRLLKSLRSAEYDSDAADLRVWVDRSAVTQRQWSLHSLMSPRSKRDILDTEVVKAAVHFTWPHGEKSVHVWDRHVGIWGQWIDSWRPSGTDDSEFGVLLEDDLEVSPLYYKWLKGAKGAYGSRRDVFGYTLQRGTLRANQTGFGRRGLKVHDREKAFLYPLLGSWGYAPEARSWAHFRDWFHEKSCEQGYHPYVEGLIPTKWYKKQEKKRSMWTMWHIKYAAVGRLYTVYANLGEERTLASNWREPGLHFRKGRDSKKASAVTKRRDFPLLEKGDGTEGSGVFEYPAEPRVLDWNGTYIDHNGERTRQ